MLADGISFDGFRFGRSPSSAVVGEVVFNTGMVGYTETMTDPSYAGQLLCFTYPLIGNYGVPDYIEDENKILRNFESDKIQTYGIIADAIAKIPSHFESKKSMGVWMESEGITGIEGVDTRELTIHLRETGVMMAAIGKTLDAAKLALEKTQHYSNINFCEEVSTKSTRTFGRNVNGKIALIDCGVKLNIVRSLVARGFEVSVMPYTTRFDELESKNYEGVVFSNGPGDPKNCEPAVDLARAVIERAVPVLGICLGTQIVALSQGADTYKLKYGHRGQNKPCIDLRTGRCLVTSQNHGYTVNEDSLQGTNLEPWFVNADDKTIEGLVHKTKPCLSVQFHPEASPGPVDASYVFDLFAEKILKES
ncbi:MAG: glutamine-hydrolyzing carbamoyl-phosphate synthase small subunit [Rhabdochlamydiaceae bacterium]